MDEVEKELSLDDSRGDRGMQLQYIVRTTVDRLGLEREASTDEDEERDPQSSSQKPKNQRLAKLIQTFD